jgi:glyoxylase-like metal-dependent hydrolase (beta-lactamase superfamily II)
MIAHYQATPGIDVLTTSLPLPGLGSIPINAFVLQGKEPMLVDTGIVGQSDAFLSTLGKLIDPADIAWLWLSHTDPDHIGALHPLLAQNPKLRVITTFLGVGIMGLFAPLPMDRVYLLNPGEQLVLADRTLTAFKPPAFDNPSTTGFYDDRTRALFTSDCFGAMFDQVPEDASDVTEKDLREGQTLWATIDAPWIHKADPAGLGRELDTIRKMDPRLILSSHLPRASGQVIERLLTTLHGAPAATPFTGPNQASLEAMMKLAG